MSELPQYKSNYRRSVAQKALEEIAKKEPNKTYSDLIEQAVILEKYLYETLTGEKNSNQFQDIIDFDVQNEYFRIQNKFFEQVSRTDQPMILSTLQKFIDQDKQPQVNEQNQPVEPENQPIVQPNGQQQYARPAKRSDFGQQQQYPRPAERSDLIPHFGIYNTGDYQLAEAHFTGPNKLTYILPESSFDPSQGLKVNLVLHMLLSLKPPEDKKFPNVEFKSIKSDLMSDLECVGVGLSDTYWKGMEQHLHPAQDDPQAICLSPDNGHLYVKLPKVRMSLKIECEGNQWQFDVTLVRTELKSENLVRPLEKYAWYRLGKPMIPDIGNSFVNEFGKDFCSFRFDSFIHDYLTENLQPLKPPDSFNLRKSLLVLRNLQNDKSLNLEEDSQMSEFLSQTLQNYLSPVILTVLYFRTYELKKEKADQLCDPDFGSKAYFGKYERDQKDLNLNISEKIEVMEQLMRTLDLF